MFKASRLALQDACRDRQHCRLSICFHFCWAWKIQNQKQIQITIWWWDEQACPTPTSSLHTYLCRKMGKNCIQGGDLECGFELLGMLGRLNNTFWHIASYQIENHHTTFHPSIFCYIFFPTLHTCTIQEREHKPPKFYSAKSYKLFPTIVAAVGSISLISRVVAAGGWVSRKG